MISQCLVFLFVVFRKSDCRPDVRGSVHFSKIHTEKSNKMQHCIKLYYFVFIWSSTCFGRHTARHQEPKSALVASGFAYVEGCWTCGCWTLTAKLGEWWKCWIVSSTTRPLVFIWLRAFLFRTCSVWSIIFFQKHLPIQIAHFLKSRFIILKLRIFRFQYPGNATTKPINCVTYKPVY
jgi:hypothetical protein